jgi:hypothetical protein
MAHGKRDTKLINERRSFERICITTSIHRLGECLFALSVRNNKGEKYYLVFFFFLVEMIHSPNIVYF